MRRKDESKKEIILDYVNRYFDDNQRTPSVRDISIGTGIAVATVHRYLLTMKENGELDYSGRRSIRTARTDKEVASVSVPVLGDVCCGPGEYEEADITEYIRLPENMVGKGTFFALNAKGESMIGAGIFPGDYVIVRQQQTAEQGDIIVALYDGLNNLKRLQMDDKNKEFVLHSENSAYEDIRTKTLDIQGVAVCVMHALNKTKK